jgi:hypothetical protein
MLAICHGRHAQYRRRGMSFYYVMNRGNCRMDVFQNERRFCRIRHDPGATPVVRPAQPAIRQATPGCGGRRGGWAWNQRCAIRGAQKCHRLRHRRRICGGKEECPPQPFPNMRVFDSLCQIVTAISEPKTDVRHLRRFFFIYSPSGGCQQARVPS